MQRLAFMLALAAAAPLAGCSSVAVLGYAEMASVINTDKTTIDHAFSQYTEMDCSSIRLMERGAYCVPPPDAATTAALVAAANAPRYCYRTLGAITCYAQPQPYNNGEKQVW